MIYLFGEYALDTQLYELRQAGTLRKVEPQVFNVLAYLIQHRDRVVSRQELLDRLWPEQFISETVLGYCVMEARKAVGDSGQKQRIIQTLRGRGFRCVADIEERQHEVAVDATPPSLAGSTSRLRTRAAVTPAPASRRTTSRQANLGTVLCAALVDPAALLEHLGVHTFQRLRQAFFALAQRQAQQHDGTLQFFGADGVLLLFAPPHTPDDHARRAVLAALGLQRSLQERYVSLDAQATERLPVRMGLHTGPLLARSDPSEGLTHAMIEETAQLAIWLQYFATPGTVLSSEATRCLVHDVVRCDAGGNVRAPGQPQPMVVYTVCEVDRNSLNAN